MTENILLTFLSDIKVDSDGTISKATYENVDGEPAEITNESAVRYILQNSTSGELSKIFIFASEKVRGKISRYNDEEITHLDYFKRRMKKFLPEVEFAVYEYDETKFGDENLKSVAEMAKLIQNYAQSKNIRLHLDLTGGMRQVIMMMLDVIRLLEYSGVEIGELIYSNFTTKRVEEVKNIYELFQLISGVEEFVNFGSVAALKKYYDGKIQSDGLKKITGAMENFAEAIKLCRYGDFRNAVENLHDAINDFKPDPQNLHDVMMARLIGKIREKYNMLIATHGHDDLKIIRWCIVNGYLQQALTLYTERIPEYLGKNFITQSAAEEEKLLAKLKGDKRSKYFYLMAEYLNGDNHFAATVNSKADKISQMYDLFLEQNAVEKIKNGKFDYDSWRENFEEYFCIPMNIDIESLIADEVKLRTRLELLNKIYGNPQILFELSAEKLAPISDILKIKQKTRKKYGDNPEKLLKDQITRRIWKENILPTLEIDTRVVRLDYMLELGIFSVNIPKKNFLAITSKYFTLKSERNNANHANETAKFADAKSLEDFMMRGIDEIEILTR